VQDFKVSVKNHARRSVDGEDEAVRLVLRIRLRERNTAFGLDRFDSQSTIRAGARENHSDRVAQLILGHGTQKMIDGNEWPGGIAARREVKHALRYR